MPSWSFTSPAGKICDEMGAAGDRKGRSTGKTTRFFMGTFRVLNRILCAVPPAWSPGAPHGPSCPVRGLGLHGGIFLVNLLLQ